MQRCSAFLLAPVLPLLLGSAVLLSLAGCERDPASSGRQSPPPPDGLRADAIVPAELSRPVPEPVETHALVAAAAIAADEPSSLTPEAAAYVPAWLPLADATPGEWVEYETFDGWTLKYEVLKVSTLAVTARVTVRQAGRTWGEPAIREDDPTLDPLAREAQKRQAVRQAEAVTIQAAGRSWEATLYQDRWTDEDVRYVRRTWVSSEVPYLGTLRMELHGDDQLEARLVLRDYGPR
jgi:hypothetical protein